MVSGESGRTDDFFVDSSEVDQGFLQCPKCPQLPSLAADMLFCSFLGIEIRGT